MTRDTSQSVRRVGDVVGITAALVGTVMLHLFMFGGDQYFPLRYLLAPDPSTPIAFVAFAGCLVALVIIIVRASRAGQWGVLTGAPVSDDVPGVRVKSRRSTASRLARRALRTAAICAALSSMFMIVFVVAVVPIFAVVFGIAAFLILGVWIVMTVLAEGRATS